MGSQEDKFSVSDQEWQNRRLCPDESCIGVIGKDGRCKECGLPADPAAAPDLAHADTLTQDSPPPDPPAPCPQAPAPEAPGDDWADRRLCSDGNCIGVIGPDGRCKECGKPYAGSAG